LKNGYAGGGSQHERLRQSLDFFCHDVLVGINSRFSNSSEALFSAKRTRIILGGIYPSLARNMLLKMTGVDIVVAGEVEEANDLWTDLSLYKNKPSYANYYAKQRLVRTIAATVRRRLSMLASRRFASGTHRMSWQKCGKNTKYGYRTSRFYRISATTSCGSLKRTFRDASIDSLLRTVAAIVRTASAWRNNGVSSAYSCRGTDPSTDHLLLRLRPPRQYLHLSFQQHVPGPTMDRYRRELCGFACRNNASDNY